MNRGDCVATVRAKVGGVFSEADVEDLLNRVAQKAIKAAKTAPDLAQREAISTAARELTHEEILKALLKKRNDLYSKQGRETATALLDGMPAKMRGSERLSAALVGTWRRGQGTAFSTAAEQVGRSARLVAPMARELQEAGQWHRMCNWYGVPDQAFPRLVARELAIVNGDGSVNPTGDEGAVKVARIIAKYQRLGVKMQNDAGAWIGDLKGYIARQTHDPGKIAGGYWREIPEWIRTLKAEGRPLSWREASDRAQAKAFGPWRDFILPLLHDRTFEGLDGRDFDLAKARTLQAKGIIRDAANERELMLYETWQNIINGRHEVLSGTDDMAEFRPGKTAALARAVSRPRTYHFKGPDEWMDYNDRYGKGGLFKTVAQQLDFAGKNAALMKRWGPSPEQGFEFQQKRLTALADAQGDSRDPKRIWSSRLQAQFETVNGRGAAPESLRLAQTMQALRTWEVVAKLGGVVLSKVPDLPLAGVTMERAGGRFFDGVKGDLTGLLRLGSQSAKQAADSLDVGYRVVMAELRGQYYTPDGVAGWGSYLGGLSQRVNGFEGVNHGFKKGFAGVWSRHMAQEAEHGWDDLEVGTRETLERFNLGPEDWEAVRHGLPVLEDGKSYFSLDHTERLAREAAEAAGLDPDTAASGFAGPDGAVTPGAETSPELRAAAMAADERHWKFATLTHNVLDDSVSHPRARESAWLTGGARPGTPLGEALRSLTQFKGFVTTIMMEHAFPMLEGYAGKKPPALFFKFFVCGLAAGYLSMSLKQLVRGELPRNPLGPDLGEDAKVWGGALAQFGGLGIYGDFLFGEQNRAGGDFGIGQVAGPILSDFEMVAQVVQQAIHGGAISPTTGRSQIPAELIRLGGHLTPFASLFYTRLAFDYFVLWQMQEAASPGFLERHEHRVETKEGGKFWLRPTSALH